MKQLIQLLIFGALIWIPAFLTSCGGQQDNSGEYEEGRTNEYGTNGSRNSIPPDVDSARDSSQRGLTVPPNERTR